MRVKSERLNCPHKECKGILHDITPKIAKALGVHHRKCDVCRETFYIEVKAKRTVT